MKENKDWGPTTTDLSVCSTAMKSRRSDDKTNLWGRSQLIFACMKSVNNDDFIVGGIDEAQGRKTIVKKEQSRAEQSRAEQSRAKL